MTLQARLADWRAAGLIDAATAERIAAHEAARGPRSVALWAVVGLGLLALALGIISLVAANWDRIPEAVKLGAHFVLTAAAGWLVWHFLMRGRAWLAEAAVFVFLVLILAGLALQGQVFQLVAPDWQLLLVWLALATPLLWLAGVTRLTAYGWTAMALWALGAWAADQPSGTLAGQLAQGLAMAVPWLVLAAAPWRANAPAFRAGLREAALTALLAGASFAHFAWADRVSAGEASEMAVRLLVALPAAALAFAVQWRRGGLPRILTPPLLAGTLLAVALATVLPHGEGWGPRLFGALAFAAMWGWIGWAAERSGWRALFGIAVATLAARLFLAYFELFGSLAMTGAGLIVAGLLLIALALGWRRMFRRSGA